MPSTDAKHASIRSSLRDAAADTTSLEVFACVFVLVAVGRITEVIPGIGGVPLAKLAMGAAIIGLVARWKSLPKIGPGLQRPLRVMGGMLALVLISVPFSVWFIPSAKFLYQVLPALVALIVLFSKLSRNWVSLRRLTLAFIASGIMLALMGLLSFGGGRLSAGVMYDTNDIAFALVVTLPMALAFLFGAQTWRKRTVFIGVSSVIVVAILLTSSRGGLLGLVTVVAAVGLLGIRPTDIGTGNRLRGLVARIMLLLIVGIPVALVSWPLLPQATRTRLETVLDLQSDYNLDANVDQGRSQVWARGLRALGERPLGYGVNSYPMVDFLSGGRMQAPHNSVLQITVELGAIGGLLFLRLYWLLWAGLANTQKLLAATGAREDDQKAILCRMMQACLAGAFVSSFFLSMAYAPLLWIAFAIALGCIQQTPASESPATGTPSATPRGWLAKRLNERQGREVARS